MEIEGDHGDESSKIKYTQKQKQRKRRQKKKKKKKKKQQIERDGDDGESPIIHDYAELEEALRTPSILRAKSVFDPFPFVLPGDTIDIKGLLFSDDRAYLIKKEGQEVIHVGPEYLLGKTIVLYLVPLNVELDTELCANQDILDAYKYFSRIAEDIVFVFVGVHIEYEFSFSEGPPIEPIPEPKPKDQEAHFETLFSTFPFPTIPFDDIAARQRVAKAFKLHLFHPSYHRYLPYWSIIDQNRTVVAAISDPSCYCLFQHFAGEELYPLTPEHIQTVVDWSVKPREMLSNLDQLLESFNRTSLLSSKKDDKVPVPVSSLKGKIIGLYISDDEPNPRNMDLIQRVCEEAANHPNLDFQIVQMRVRFHPTSDVSTSFRCKSPQQSVSEQQTVNWLELPFEDPRCKQLLRILSHVCRPDIDQGDSVYGRVVIFQANRKTFEFSGAEILQEYGIKGYPFTRERLFEVEKEIVKETVKLRYLFPPGKHDLTELEGDKYVPTVNDKLHGKKVLVYYAFEPEIHCCEYMSLLKSKYKDGGFEVLYVSFESNRDICEPENMPWLRNAYSRDLELRLRNKLFKCVFNEFYDFLSGGAAFDEDGELITKFYDLDAWSEENKDDNFPYFSVSLEDTIRREVCTICKLGKFSSELD